MLRLVVPEGEIRYLEDTVILRIPSMGWAGFVPLIEWQCFRPQPSTSFLISRYGLATITGKQLRYNFTANTLNLLSIDRQYHTSAYLSTFLLLRIRPISTIMAATPSFGFEILEFHVGKTTFMSG